MERDKQTKVFRKTPGYGERTFVCLPLPFGPSLYATWGLGRQ